MEITLTIDVIRQRDAALRPYWGGKEVEIFRPDEIEFEMYGIILSPKQYEKVYEKLKEIQELLKNKETKN